jgi:preprotein translocase subunit YajC
MSILAIVALALTLAPTAALAQGMSGTVSRIDTATRTVYFTDGRVVQLQPGAVVTVSGREVALESVAPGSTMTIVAAAPSMQQPIAQSTYASRPPALVGTVRSVDQGSSVIALNDGAFVKVKRTTRLQSGGRTVLLSELRPGDRIAVWPYERSAALGPATATVPRGDNPPAAAVEADYIEVTRPAS